MITQRKSGGTLFLFRNPKWRIFVGGILVTALAPLLLLMEVHSTTTSDEGPQSSSIKADQFTTAKQKGMVMPGIFGAQQQRGLLLSLLKKNPDDDDKGGQEREATSSALLLSWQKVIEVAETAEVSVLNFFHGEARALQDGAPIFSSKRLIERLVERMQHCHDPHRDDDNCVFRMVYVGGAQMAGRDNLFNRTFPFVAEHRLRAVTEAAGLTLEVLNHAMDYDLNREGPQTAHMCVANFMPQRVDVVGWGLDDIMQNQPHVQLEAFVRWTITTVHPAMILVNRHNGPHGASRRGESQFVAEVSHGHNAILYKDQEALPEKRQEPYSNTSQRWKQQWSGKRNKFWMDIFDTYSSVMDFAAVDPAGSIWHLDHLPDFSNDAFDADKALPLLDCGPPHPPPCDQVAPAILKHMRAANLSNASLPEHQPPGAVVCGVKWGCAHYWYGGSRSHALRGELNALPMIRALKDAAKRLSALSKNEALSGPTTKQTSRTLQSMASLPNPKYCHKKYCSRIPTCITAYEPNFGLKLRDTFLSNETAPAPIPQLSIAHYANNPLFSLRDIEKSLEPLGYPARHYGFRLTTPPPPKKHRRKNEEPPIPDAYKTAVAFTTTDPGPLLICEPPCYIDECASNRKWPLPKHAILELDDALPLTSATRPVQIEVGGKHCSLLEEDMPSGDHILRISTNLTAPEHVIFSHIITFTGEA